jgi:integrase
LPLNGTFDRAALRPTMPTSTVAEFASRFLTEYAGPPWHPKKNVSHARNVLNRYILPDLGEIPLRAVEPAHLRRVQRKMLAAGLGVNTCKSALQSVWGSFWKAARSEGLVAGKPHGELTWPRNDPQPDPFTAAERDLILAWFQKRQPHYLPLVGSVFLAGMRPSEAAGLRWGDIDLDTGEVTIARALASREQTRGKTSKSLRQIRVAERLRKLYEYAKPGWAEGSALCCTTRFKKPIHSAQWGNINFKTCCEELGIRYRGFYHGRHTFISLSLMEQGNPMELSAFCAVTVATMQRHYWRWMGSVQDPVTAFLKRDLARLDREKPAALDHARGA